ncbi:MAG: peptidylprolyl isomerase [Planctomycetota bacterium]|jgi:hypothetical protein
MRKHIFILVLGGLLAEGCGQKNPKLSAAQMAGPEDLVVAGRLVTSDEIIKPVKKRLAPIARASSLEGFKLQAAREVEAALNDRISYLVLYEEVKKEMGDKIDEGLNRGAEQEVRRFLVGFDGDYTRAEEYLEEQGMDWESFRDYQKKMMLISSRMPEARPIPYNELLEHYESMKDEFFRVEGTITICLIDIRPAKLVSANPGEDPLERARELAGDVARRIRSGEDFEALARQYSHGHRRDLGGLWKPINPESLAAPYDVLAHEAEKMVPGQIAGPIETEGSEHIFIMRFEEKQAGSYKPFEQVQGEIEGRIALRRRAEAVAAVDAKLARQVPGAQRRDFVNLCLDKIYRSVNQ